MSQPGKQVTVHASKHAAPHKAKGGGKKTLHHLSVTPMANGGATVEHHFMPPSDGMAMAPPSETHAFMKPKQAGAHVASMLQGMPGAAPATSGAPSNAAMDGDSGNDAA
jgi:hypothetical protein